MIDLQDYSAKDTADPRNKVDIGQKAREAGLRPEGKSGEWTLVLEAMGIPYQFVSGRILITPSSAPRALDNILAYERENIYIPQGDAGGRSLPWSENLLILGGLLLFFSLVQGGVDLPGLGDLRWTGKGAADSGAILSGQWWLGLTALTLHADPAHVLGNVVFGAPFVVLVCSRLGTGLGWAGIVFSGWAGNMLNAWIRGPGHLSIGFSTAVFAAAGLMVTVNKSRRGLKNGIDAVVMALALLALLGAGGENTDLAAHFWGVFCGLALGTILRFQPLPLPPSKAISSFLGAATFLALVVAWNLALASSPPVTP